MPARPGQAIAPVATAMVGVLMRHRVVVLLAALAVALAGCGGGASHADSGAGPSVGAYASAVNRAQDELARRLAALERGAGPTSTAAEDRRALAAYERAVRTTAGRLRAVAAPAVVASLHRRLVAEVGRYGASLHAIQLTIRDGDARSLLVAQGRLAAAVARAQRALAATVGAINRKLGG